MPMELMMLALSTVWLAVLIAVMAMMNIRQHSIPTLVGARDNLPDPDVMVARGKRAVDNLREGLIMFAPFALIVVIQDLSSPLTVMGAQLFFYARIAHGLLYFGGVPWLRTVAWTVGIVGTVMVAWPIFF